MSLPDFIIIIIIIIIIPSPSHLEKKRNLTKSTPPSTHPTPATADSAI